MLIQIIPHCIKKKEHFDFAGDAYVQVVFGYTVFFQGPVETFFQSCQLWISALVEILRFVEIVTLNPGNETCEKNNKGKFDQSWPYF